MRKFHLAYLATILLLFLPRPDSALGIETAGAITGIQVVDADSNHSKVVCSIAGGGEVEVTAYASDLVRVRFHWTPLFEQDAVAIDRPLADWPAFSANYVDLGNTFEIQTDDLIVEIVKAPNFKIHFKDRDEWYYLLRDDRTEYDPGYNATADSSYQDLRWTGALPQGFKLKAIKEMPSNEAYFGLGAYGGPLNRRGTNIQCWNSDSYHWGEFSSPLYTSFPFFYGVQGQTAEHPPFTYGIFFHNPARAVFKMGTEWGDRYSFEAADGQIDYFFFGGGSSHTMPEVLTRYAELTGKPYMLPKWAFGFHQSRWSYDTQDWVQDIADQARAEDFPMDAVYVDIDYMDSAPDDYYQDGSLHQLTFNSNFPDPAGMIDYCDSLGVKLVPLIEPWISTLDPKWQEGNDANHFLEFNDGSTQISNIWFGPLSWLDFSSTPARDWWRGKVLGFLDQYPFEGIWNDLNEPAENNSVPLDSLFSLDGRFNNGAADDHRNWYLNVKNTYNIYECSLTHQILREKHPNKRPFVLSRSGWPGIQKYALGWSGDNTASFDHLRHNIRLGLSVMMSGQANFGHDVGGFIGTSGGELMTRWTEWAIFNPYCRNHAQKWDPLREPWSYPEPYRSHLRDSIKFRYELMPYLYSLAHESTLSGIPMNTPTVFHFAYDTETHYQNDNDFMVGDHLLVAPVYTEGATDRWVYLPDGTDWYDWHTGEKYSGGDWVNVEAPLGTIPLFARAGGILPMGPVMSHVNEFKPGYMDIHVWPNGHSEFRLYEDDGETMDYLSGEYAQVQLTSDRVRGSWTFNIGAREGSYDPGSRVYMIMANDLEHPLEVRSNGAIIAQKFTMDEMHASESGWNYDSATRVLRIKVPDTGAANEVRATFSDAPVAWVGNTYHWPANGNLYAGNDLWINSESWPQGAAVSAEVVYSVNGGDWNVLDLAKGQPSGGNDTWWVNLGAFSAGDTIRYAIVVDDGIGVETWDNNQSQDFTATVQ